MGEENNTYKILKSVLNSDSLDSINNEYECFKAVYDDDNDALRVNITNLPVDDGVGITLNSDYISGVKAIINSGETLNIPADYQYNVVGPMIVNGTVTSAGNINLIENTFTTGFTLTNETLTITRTDAVDLTVDLSPLFIQNIVEVTGSTYSMTATDDILLVNCLSACTITIPTAYILNGKGIIIKDASFNSSVNNITIVGQASELIDGETSLILNEDGNSYTLVFNNSAMFII